MCGDGDLDSSTYTFTKRLDRQCTKTWTGFYVYNFSSVFAVQNVSVHCTNHLLGQHLLKTSTLFKQVSNMWQHSIQNQSYYSIMWFHLHYSQLLMREGFFYNCRIYFIGPSLVLRLRNISNDNVARKIYYSQ